MDAIFFLEPNHSDHEDYVLQWRAALKACEEKRLPLKQFHDLRTLQQHMMVCLNPPTIVGCSLANLDFAPRCILISFESASARSLDGVIIDYRQVNKALDFCGPAYNLTDQPSSWFFDLIGIVKILEWDSKFFGFGVAHLSTRRVTASIQEVANSLCHENKIRLLEYLANPHDVQSVEAAENCGFHLADIRLTLEADLQHDAIHAEPPPETYGLATESHIAGLREIVRGMYADSRYYSGNYIARSSVDAYYQTWIEKAVLGTFDHECHCLFDDQTVTAFCTIRFTNTNEAQIGLFGVNRAYQNRGLAVILLRSVLHTVASRGIVLVTVVTQGKNYSAQRVYQKVGFKTAKIALWYHKWLELPGIPAKFNA